MSFSLPCSLVDQLLAKSSLNESSSSRIIIGIAGIPGAGKSTLTNALAQEMEAIAPGSAVVVPMDGFHYTRAKLDTFPNAEEAHRRRGACWTFDADGMKDLIQRIRQQPLSVESAQPVLAPSFDHAVKDPKENDIAILPRHRFVLVEGLYLHLSEPVWSDIFGLFDLTCFVNCDIDVAMERVARRHVAAGICSTLEEALVRANTNDRVNAEFIVAHRLSPSFCV